MNKLSSNLKITKYITEQKYKKEKINPNKI